MKTDIFDGGSIEIDLKANVSTIKVVSLKCDYPLSNETLGTLSTGAILDMESVNRCARFKSQAVSIPYNKEVLISLVLEDTQRDRSLHIDIELSL